MGAQVLCQSFLVASTPDCDRTESHVPRKLNTKMPQSSDALHGDQISAAQAGIAKCVVGRNPSAEQGSGLCGRELIRNRTDAARFGDHHFRISSIHGYSWRHRVLTIDDVSTAARFAHTVFSGDEADTNPLADFPSRH